MPLLGKKPFVCSKPLSDIQPDETIYIIPHTKEQFKSKQEYEKRLSWYKQPIWTCRCTGHVNLTHQAAWESEKAIKKSLKDNFPKVHEKSVLELVHHSTAVLDTLVDQGWLKIQQVLSINEKVSLKVKAEGKTISGKVVKIDKAGVEANPTSNCSSPSSDKENSTTEVNRDSSPKKWVPPKLLHYKYSVELEDGKVINSVPADDLVRDEKPPLKECVRHFIRCYAVRSGQNPTCPWVVDSNKVKEYSIASKFADFLVSPLKMAEVAKRAEEEMSRKRKSSSHGGSASKKAKIDKISKKNSAKKDNKKQLKLTGSPLKKKPSSKKISGAVVVSESSSEDDTPLSQRSLSPKKKKSPSKKVKSDRIVVDSDSDDEPSSSKEKSPKKKAQKKIPNGDISSDSDEESVPLAKIKSKSMKQMTLFDMSKKKGMKTPEKKKSTPIKKKFKSPQKGMRTPDKKPKVMSPPKTPAVVSKLVLAVKAKDKGKIKGLLETACKVLTLKQRGKLPVSVKEMVESSIARREEKRKLDAMTPEQREEYQKQKRQAQKRKRQEELKEKKKKFEDTELDLEPLPEMKLVTTPDGLPNELFGDVAMVTEFISCYQGLLIPNKEFPVSAEKLMQSIGSGKEGFSYLSKILSILLQTLLQDQISEDYQEIKISLSDIPVNSYTTSELVRLCLRKQDVQEDHNSDSDDEDNNEDEVPEEIIQLLESQELYDLDGEQKVKILKGLCLRIMGTYSVQDYMEEKQNEATQLWKKKMAELKKKNDKLRKEKELKKEMGDKSKQGEEKPADDKEKPTSKDVLLTSFYGKASVNGGDSSKGTTPDVSADEGTDGGGDQSDLASVVKRRRLLANQAAAEREKKDQERREQKQREYEEYMEQKERIDLEKAFTEGIGAAKHVLRVTPVGTDRNHNRYWVFSKATPGIYIEKGWVTDNIEYCSQKNKSSESDEESSDEDTRSKSQDEEISFKPQADVSEEKTVPHNGQNLWFTYNTLAEIDELLKKLHPQGYRESQLIEELKKRYDHLSKGLNGSQQPKKVKTEGEEEEEEDLVKAFRKELLETEIRLKNGGLGGVPDFDSWDARLETATEIADFGQLLIESQENILEKFRQGMMANKKRRSKVTEVKGEEVEEEDLDDSKEEETEVAGVVNWREAVKNCPTMSRLHVLMGMLDSCIKWEKSAENVKCKICRKKTDESKLLLCDECNQPFHMFCLRPALLEVPEEDWFCPACAPKDLRRKGKEMPGDSEDEEGDIKHEKNCIECGGDEGLIFCSDCPSAYHLDCHHPPLRREPRGNWSCNDCKVGIKRSSRWRSQKRNALINKRAAPKRKNYKEWSTENSDEESEEEAPKSGRRGRVSKQNKDSSDSEEEAPSRGRRGRAARRKQDSSDTEEEAPSRGRRGRPARRKQEDSEESEEESDEPRPSGRRGRISRKRREDSDESEAETKSSTRRSDRARKTYKEDSESDSESEETSSRKRKRGRPSKGKTDDSDTEEEQPPTKAARKSRQQSSSRSKKGQTSAKSSPVIEEKKATSRRAPSDLSICEQIVANLMKHKSCWPFLNPVNKKEVPDYYEIIKHPLDFQIVKDRLQCLVYGSVEECLEDVKVVFNNCETYNPEGSEILECMREVEEYFRGQVEKYLPQVLYYRKTLTNGH
ncbi:BAZ1B [Mytilus coruscus]|uniref:Tyrosine-protein kinase BAZ1B n=2 Tax=Mytilus coruscus TaxID=42192 RepID=A0A6J8E8U6_MYTCO|nr:BAZ1B [Mytilus coruscus]